MNNVDMYFKYVKLCLKLTLEKNDPGLLLEYIFLRRHFYEKCCFFICDCHDDLIMHLRDIKIRKTLIYTCRDICLCLQLSVWNRCGCDASDHLLRLLMVSGLISVSRCAFDPMSPVCKMFYDVLATYGEI